MANQKIDIPQPVCEPGKVNRRAVLTGTVATAAALAATSFPADAAESPRDVIKRAGRELADALNHYDDGRWHALVYPSSKVENGVWLGNRMNVHYWQRWQPNVRSRKRQRNNIRLSNDWPGWETGRAFSCRGESASGPKLPMVWILNQLSK